jgi:flavin-binding protein dodecin
VRTAAAFQVEVARPGTHRRSGMAIHKVIEVLSQSEKSWEEAAQRAVADAAKSVRHIKSIYIKNMEGVVRDDRIVEYRVNANITFELEA